MFEDISFDLTKIPYGRRGSFFYLGLWETGGKQLLYACALYSGMDTAPSGQTARCGKLFPIKLFKDGISIDYSAKATPRSVTLYYECGIAQLCIQDGDILRMETSGGVDVVLSPDLSAHEIAKNRNDGSWEVIMNPVPKMLFYPIIGNLEVTTGFDVINSIPSETKFVFTPNAEGKSDLAVHLYLSNTWHLQKYPLFDECIFANEADFSKYLDTVPSLPAKFNEARILEAYIVWSHILSIDGTDIIFMNKGIHRFTSSWQQSYHAMGQYKNPKFAWDLLLSVFRYQDDYGMLPDCLYDSYQSFGGCKPPLQGVALEFLKKYTDFSFVSAKEYLSLYKGLSDLVFWWLSFRDTDNDGIAQYDTADESGWDDSSFFSLGGPIEAPDLATYLILSMDNLAEIAERLGRTYEAREWKSRASSMLEKMLAFFWTGEKFEARKNETHEWVSSGTITAYIPLLLGKRLPLEIINKMTETLSQEGVWLTPFGLAGERLDSIHYHETGWSAGPVLAPIQLLIVLGLDACGKEELAKSIAMRYCHALINANYPMVLNAKNGQDVSEARWSTRYPNRMSWTAMVFLLLGSVYGT